MNGEAFLGYVGRLVVLVLGALLLFFNVVGLPGNWLLLAVAVVFALVTEFQSLGWGTLAVLAGLALLAEALEFAVGMTYTAKQGRSRRGTLGAFLGGLVGAVAAGGIAPPLGALIGAFGGTFVGAFLLEYTRERQREASMRVGRAAFIGRILASAVKTLCGFWMWCVLVYRLLIAR